MSQDGRRSGNSSVVSFPGCDTQSKSDPLVQTAHTDGGPRRGPGVLQTRNKLLAGLTEVQSHLSFYVERVALPSGALVIASGRDVQHVLLVEAGFAGVGFPDGPNSVDVAMIGREGMLGAGSLFGSPMSLFPVIARAPLTLLRAPAGVFDDALRRSPELKCRVIGFASAIVRQLAATAYANARLSVEQRVARWISMAAERLEAPTISATHDELAAAVGCRRAGVTVAIHCLEGEGMIRATRGKLTVLDSAGLGAFAAGAARTSAAEPR